MVYIQKAGFQNKLKNKYNKKYLHAKAYKRLANLCRVCDNATFLNEVRANAPSFQCPVFQTVQPQLTRPTFVKTVSPRVEELMKKSTFGRLFFADAVPVLTERPHGQDSRSFACGKQINGQNSRSFCP